MELATEPSEDRRGTTVVGHWLWCCWRMVPSEVRRVALVAHCCEGGYEDWTGVKLLLTMPGSGPWPRTADVSMRIL